MFFHGLTSLNAAEPLPPGRQGASADKQIFCYYTPFSPEKEAPAAESPEKDFGFPRKSFLFLQDSLLTIPGPRAILFKLP
jgi:hypothetical protein